MTDSSTLSTVLTFFGAFCLALSFIADIYLYFTIGRKFDKIFGHIETRETWSYYGGYANGRLECYMSLITGYKSHKRDNSDIYQLFSGYNFREHVTTFQVVMIRVYRWSAIIGLISLFIAAKLMHISFF